MAVYTNVSQNDLRHFLSDFDIGDAISLHGITEGIENTNFRLRTTTGLYILTLYEKRVNPRDLPFFLTLIDHLAKSGFPCPGPIAALNGEFLHELSGRPAAIVNFATGAWPRKITPDHCHELGSVLGRLHKATASLKFTRKNDYGLSAWRSAFSTLGRYANELEAGFDQWIEEELVVLESSWPSGLPVGIIHGDLFPDNVFFEHGRVSGLIDFYFASTDALALDLAICINAWCFEEGYLDIIRTKALIAGYQNNRQLQKLEREALPILGRGAAMRFLITRLHDWFFTPSDVLAQRKDPLDFVPIIQHYQTAFDPEAIGLGSPHG